MPSSGHLTRFLMDGVELSTDSFSLDVSIDTPQEDATTFQSAAAASVSMIPVGSIGQNGYLAIGANSRTLEAKLQDSMMNNRVVAALFGTNIVACPAYVLPDADGNNMKISVGQKLMTIAGKWGGGTQGIKRGIRVFQGLISATGAQAGVDLGSAGSNGGLVYLFVYDITGTASNAQIKVQSDSASNFATAADEVAISFSARNAFVGVMTGVVGRYIRLNTVSMGGATNFSVAAVVCVNGVTM